ncbi:hypothetical protein BBO99_00005942 [Phytophthora kernoviae]|uniref:RING-type domain-containing protein n=1 Tax=Phytophthora kernoviae TaxID=325452 RepID=A0A3R7H0E5_9STRA|nr:hypothetical protein JM16_005745 [Phytophthora kernoviae]RLN02645.1 hypothetical protein BBI17_006004 [Phytophthora kernoviae]RLN78485.1 hypothetical protein BBO99_00005942 [Phytophthora kernoviae]
MFGFWCLSTGKIQQTAWHDTNSILSLAVNQETMNSFFVPEPNASARPDPQLTEFAKRGNCKNYTLKTLGSCVHQDLPLRVSVTSTTKKEDYTVYNCTISSATTKNAWGVSYRYSEFLVFRNKVEEQWTCQEKDCSGSCQAIRDVVVAFFPKKRPAIMSTWTGTIADRKTKLENVLVHLLRCVLLTGSAMKCFHARQNLPRNLFEFLGVKHDTDKRSLLQIFVDVNQPGMKKSATTTDLSMLEHQSKLKKSSTTPDLSSLAPKISSDDQSNSEQCMICLDDVSLDTTHEIGVGDNSPITLQCSHCFHRECIFEWLLFQYKCPVCRAQVGPDATTNYCRPKNQVQWWLGDFKQSPLNLTTTNGDSSV